MPSITIKGRNVPIELWAPIEEVDTQVITQLKNVAALPWVAHHVAVMPDVHLGKGATVGSVIAMRGAVAPAAVGVDIGCGMAAVEDQPHGEGSARRSAPAAAGDRGRDPGRPRWHTTRPPGSTRPSRCATTGQALMERYATLDARVHAGARSRARWARWAAATTSSRSAWTRSDAVWLMLHSGSRATSARCWPSTTSRSRAASSTTRRSRTATWPCSWPGRRCSTPTAAISSGRRSTPASTAR